MNPILPLFLSITLPVLAQPDRAPKSLAEARTMIEDSFRKGTLPPDPAFLVATAKTGEPAQREEAQALLQAGTSLAELQALWRGGAPAQKLSPSVQKTYAAITGKTKKPELLASARMTYGLELSSLLAATPSGSLLQQHALPDNSGKAIGLRMNAWKNALGETTGPGSLPDSISGRAVVAGASSADRSKDVARYAATPAIKTPKPAAAPPPPPGEPKPAARLNAQEQAVQSEVTKLRDTLSGGNLQGYIKPKDKEQILGAWEHAMKRSVDASGNVDYPNAVNLFQNELLNGREAGTVTRTAEHWAEITAGTYNLGRWAGPPAAIGASLLWNGFSITKSQLVRCYRYYRGQGPLPPSGNYWGEAMNHSIVTESAAAGWASTLPNPHKVNILAGSSKTLKLDEFNAALKQDGAKEIGKGFLDRYFGK